MLEMNAASDDDELLASLETKKMAIEAAFGKPQWLVYAKLAKDAGLEKLFELSYRLTSGDAAHATLGAFRRHIRPGQDGHLDQYFFSPDASDMRATLLSANFAMIHLIGLGIGHMGLNDVKDYAAEANYLLVEWAVVKDRLDAPDR